MQAITFTVVAIILYFLSDWIVTRIEIARGERMVNRTLYFFFILLVLALVSFKVIDQFWVS